MASSEKPIALQQQKQQQQGLKCPRCDSSNTKFCYYNNYNLSQPRHFCKACKRYWTKGGTLRNVPVGGGCRKNKRMKIPPITSSTAPTTTKTAVATSTPPLHRNPNPNLENHVNPLLYGLLPQNPNYIPRFDTRVSNINETLVPGYEFLEPQVSVPGLGFSSSDPLSASFSHNSTLLHPSYSSSMFVGSSSSSTSAPMAASTLQQQRFMGFEGGSMMKNYQIEESNVGLADPNSLLWSTAAGGGTDWLDP